MKTYWIILIEKSTPFKSFVSWNDDDGIAFTFETLNQAVNAWFDDGMDTVAVGRPIEITKTSL